MLTTAEEDRLEAELPLQYDVTHGGNTYQYDLTPFWANNDADGDDASDSVDYPALVFDKDMQGRQDTERQPVGDVAEVEYPADEPTIVEHHVARATDDVMLTVAVTANHDQNGVPPTTRARQMIRQLWRFVNFHLGDALAEEGPNGERPMVVEVLEQPRDERVGRTYRVEFPIRFRHVEHEAVEQDAVDDVAYDTETN